MPYPSFLQNIGRYHPNAQAILRDSYSQIADAANRMGIAPEQYIEREKAMQLREEEDKLEAMDSNKSKFMSPEEKSRKLNAYKNRRFLELGIGHVPEEYGI